MHSWSRKFDTQKEKESAVKRKKEKKRQFYPIPLHTRL